MRVVSRSVHLSLEEGETLEVTARTAYSGSLVEVAVRELQARDTEIAHHREVRVSGPKIHPKTRKPGQWTTSAVTSIADLPAAVRAQIEELLS